jgi:hypothetical protein
MERQAEFHRAQAAKMREYAENAPTVALRKMFEDIAAEYEKLAAREDEIVRWSSGRDRRCAVHWDLLGRLNRRHILQPYGDRET